MFCKPCFEKSHLIYQVFMKHDSCQEYIFYILLVRHPLILNNKEIYFNSRLNKIIDSALMPFKVVFYNKSAIPVFQTSKKLFFF